MTRLISRPAGALAATLALGVFAAACGGGSGAPGAAAGGDGAEGGGITLATWGGAYTKADVAHFLQPFERESGTTFRTADAPGEFVAKLEAQAKAGNVQWDVLNPDEADAEVLAGNGLLQKLPADVRARIVKAVGAGNVSDYGVSVADYADVIVCNPAAVKRCPRTPAEFWDTEGFPGPRAMYGDGWVENLLFALEADGVPTDQLFPVDVARAYRKLDAIKSHVDVWWTSGDQSQQILRDEEVGMAIMWDGRAYQLEQQGLDVEISHTGATVHREMFVVPKDAPNPKQAFAFLEWYATHPEEGAKWVEEMRYGVANPQALEHLPDDVARTIATHPDNLRQSVRLDVPWMTANRAQLFPRWNSWLGK